MPLALTNARVFTGEKWIEDGAVVIVGEEITDVLPLDHLPQEMVKRDLGGKILAPGFIDLQVNGGGGVLFNEDPSPETIRKIARAHRRFGTTGLLPTLITDTEPVMKQALAAVQEALADREPGIFGIHLEGPYLNPLRKGVHREEVIRPMEEGALDLLTSLEEGRTLVTLAPEKMKPGVISALVRAGVRVSAGHTAGSYTDYLSAFDEGLSGFTHLFNAMSPLTSREPGAVGAALDDENCWCGLIVDGYHVHPATLRAAIRAKSRGKMMLVTDAMPTVGSDQDHFILHGQTICRKEGRCVTADGTLAGAHLDMASAVRNTVDLLGLSLEEALRMASLYPATYLGLNKAYGKIAPGYRASMVLLDDELQVADSWVDGNDMLEDRVIL